MFAFLKENYYERNETSITPSEVEILNKTEKNKTNQQIALFVEMNPAAITQMKNFPAKRYLLRRFP